MKVDQYIYFHIGLSRVLRNIQISFILFFCFLQNWDLDFLESGQLDDMKKQKKKLKVRQWLAEWCYKFNSDIDSGVAW